MIVNDFKSMILSEKFILLLKRLGFFFSKHPVFNHKSVFKTQIRLLHYLSNQLGKALKPLYICVMLMKPLKDIKVY